MVSGDPEHAGTESVTDSSCLETTCCILPLNLFSIDGHHKQRSRKIIPPATEASGDCYSARLPRPPNSVRCARFCIDDPQCRLPWRRRCLRPWKEKYAYSH